MTSSMTLEGASSSSSSPRPYDVFLSFRGKDTRNNFTAHLCKTLREKGIYTYMDDKLRMGDEIGPELLKAINESKIAIVVLSKNYASSTWCLRELEKILECKKTNQQIIMPVFYEVDPSDVRHLKKSFGEALATHKSRYLEDSTVEHWKAALQKVANLSGKHLVKGNEFEVMDQIVQEVVSRMAKLIPILHVTKYPVGIKSRVNQINELLGIGMNDKRMVGIFGCGGIGKTTIAKAIYNSIAYQFEGSCFLANVRENSKRECGLVQLQETLLSDILGDSNLKIRNVDRGINIIKERLCHKRVFLVLDDVDELFQLEALSGALDWFGLGSRIIITTRDKHLLTKHKVNLTYLVNELDYNEAFQLFSLHTFPSNKPTDDFVELTKHALHYAGGLPLALIVIGSDLCGRDGYYWKSVLEKYRRIPHKDIHEKLKISYDGLQESEKNIFLDIACFFKGMAEAYVIKILDNCDFFASIGIQVLMEKSLITIGQHNTLVMHDLLQDMGREIVRQESPKELGKRSRLWYHKDVRRVFKENMGTNKIEGILVDLPERDWGTCLSCKTFEKMTSLRVFINYNARFSGNLKYLSNELRVLDWFGYPLQSFPSNFQGEKLVVLRIHNSPLRLLKDRFKDFQNLTTMELSRCKFLMEILDISRIPNLEVLKVEKCDSLVKVHDSVGFLDKLTSMHFSRCSNLITLPRRLELRSLENLYFGYCARLQNFPEIGGKMERFRHLHLIRCIALKELPSSIEYFTGLSLLSIYGCKNLTHLPSCLQLHYPNILRHGRRSKVVKLPTKVRDERESMLSVVSTEESKISSSTKLFASPPPANACIFDDGSSSIAFPALTFLSINKCTGLEKPEFFMMPDRFSSLQRLNLSETGSSSIAFPALECLMIEKCAGLERPEFFMTLDRFSNLRHLNLSGTVIVRLPACIKGFVRLQNLDLTHCRKLKEIPELPPNIEDISVCGCVSLVSFPEISKIFQFNTSGLRRENWIDLCGCYKLAENIGNQVENILLDKGLCNGYYDGGIAFPGNTIPAWFSHRKEIPYGNYSCAIHINGLSNLDEIKGIAFCAVFGSRPGVRVPYKEVRCFSIEISRKGIEIERIFRQFSIRDKNHVWLEYLVLEPFVLEEDILQVDVFTSSKSFIKSWGVHMIYKHYEENAKDHPSLIQVDFNFCPDCSDDEVFNSSTSYFSTSEDESEEENENSGCSAEEDDFDEIERVLDGIQPSKRHRDAEDEDDCNLESSYYPQQKKRSSTMGESQLNQSDHSQC